MIKNEISFKEMLSWCMMNEDALMEIEEENGTVKQYQNIDGNWELLVIKDEDGVHELTSIPDDRFCNYKVDLHRGRIYSIKSNRFLKTNASRTGYHYTTLAGIPIAVHVVVAMAKYQMHKDEWLAKGMSVNHIDYDKGNQKADNLEIVFHFEQFDENVRKRMGTGKRLTDEQVRHIKLVSEILKIKDEYAINKVSHYYADAYSKDYVTIFNLLKGNTYKNIELTDEQQIELSRLRLMYDLEQLELIA